MPCSVMSMAKKSFKQECPDPAQVVPKFIQKINTDMAGTNLGQQTYGEIKFMASKPNSPRIGKPIYLSNIY